MASPGATGTRIRCRLAGLLALAAWCTPCGAAELFRDDRIARRAPEFAELRSRDPQPKLRKQIATPKFGTGRNVRYRRHLAHPVQAT